MPTIPVWVPPVASASTLNQQRKPSLNILAEGQSLPIIYGAAQVPGKIFALDYDSGTETWTVGVAWAIGACTAIDALYLNGATPVGGVSYNNYLGTTGQTADALLSAAVSGYADDLVITLPAGDIGVCYTAFQYTNAEYSTLPQFVAEIRGLQCLQGAPTPFVTGYTDNPALCLYNFITNDYYGMGQSADYASFYAVSLDNVATVTTEARRIIGLALSSPLPAIEWVKILSVYASCWTYKVGDTWYATSDRPRTQDAALTSDDWVEGSFALQIADKNQIPTVVELVYTDTVETLWRERIVSKELSGVSSGTVPRRVSRVRMPGVTRYSQAAREAQERLNKLQQFLSISYDGYDDELVRLPGDVIDITRSSQLVNVDFRVNAPPSKDASGLVQVQAIKYSSGDYVDTEEADPTYGVNNGFLGDGVVSSGAVSLGNTIALQVNTQADGTANVGEASLFGINTVGGIDYSSDGFFLYDGTVYTVPRAETSSAGTVLTGLAGIKGFICYETAEDDPFTVFATPTNCAFVYRNDAGAWYYDNNGTGIAFTPTDTMVALAWMETDTADLIANGGLLGAPVPLTLAAYPGSTDGAIVGSNLYDFAGGVITDAMITNFDDASALGFNPMFSEWANSASPPDDWTQYVTATGRSRVTSPKLTGPYALQFVATGSNVGISHREYVAFHQDSIVVGSIDVYLTSVTSGIPGILFDIVEATTSNGYRRNVPINTSLVGVWQRVYFKVSRRDYTSLLGTPTNVGFRSILIYVMGSYTGFGSFTGTVVFDNLRFAILSPDVENEAQLWADISGTGLPEDNATEGATLGTNVYLSDGSTVIDDDVTVDAYADPASAILWSTYEAGGWSPVDTTLAVTVKFFRGATQIASRVINATLTDSGANEGDILLAAGTSTGEATTVSISSNNSPTPVATVTHTASGKTWPVVASAQLPGYSGGVSK